MYEIFLSQAVDVSKLGVNEVGRCMTSFLVGGSLDGSQTLY